MSIKDSQQLKQLQSRKAKLEVSVADLKKQLVEAQGLHDKALNQLKSVLAEIDSLAVREVVVTEHAVLRYIERAMGVDIDHIKDQILTSETRRLIENLGNGKYPIGNKLRVIVKNNTIISVV